MTTALKRRLIIKWSNTFKIDPRLIVPFFKFNESESAKDCLLSATWSAYNKKSPFKYFDKTRTYNK